MFGRWKKKRDPGPPDTETDAPQAQESEYTADPRELVGPESVTPAESPGPARERPAEEP